MIAARDNTMGTELNITTTTEICATAFDCHGKIPLTVGAMNHPPSSEIVDMEELCRKMKDLYLENPRSTVWIAGDMKLRDIDRESSTIRGKSNPNQTNHLLLDLIYICDNIW